MTPWSGRPRREVLLTAKADQRAALLLGMLEKEPFILLNRIRTIVASNEDPEFDSRRIRRHGNGLMDAKTLRRLVTALEATGKAKLAAVSYVGRVPRCGPS